MPKKIPKISQLVTPEERALQETMDELYAVAKNLSVTQLFATHNKLVRMCNVLITTANYIETLIRKKEKEEQSRNAL